MKWMIIMSGQRIRYIFIRGCMPKVSVIRFVAADMRRHWHIEGFLWMNQFGI